MQMLLASTHVSLLVLFWFHRELRKKVLVHCKMGISRSAATVTAFAMKEYRMSLKEALAHVKSRRSVVNPNDGFVNQLRDYEGILKARYVFGYTCTHVPGVCITKG